MQNVILTVMVLLSIVILVWFFLSTQKTFQKYNRLDKTVREKLSIIEHRMYFVRRLTITELDKIRVISDEEIKEYDDFRNMDLKLRLLREKLNNIQETK